MENLHHTEEEAIEKLRSVFDRMEELALEMNPNRQKDHEPLSRNAPKQITLFDKSVTTIRLQIPNVPTTFK